MINRIIFMLLCITVVKTAERNQYKKCSDVRQGTCGLNAKCYDNKNDPSYKKFNGAYCKCNENFHGQPPNCKECQDDDHCYEDEYCEWDEFKCKEGCRFGGCPKRTICDYNSRECIEGCSTDEDCRSNEYCNKSERKCRKVCDDFSCGPNAKCGSKYHRKYCTCLNGFILRSGSAGGCVKSDGNKKFSCDSCKNSFCDSIKNVNYCYCPTDNSADPFQYCPLLVPASTTTYRPILKPGQDDMISLAAIATLATG